MRGRDQCITASHPCKNFWTSFFVKRQWTSISIPNADSSMTPLATLSWAGFRGGQGGLVSHLYLYQCESNGFEGQRPAGSFIDMVAWKNWKSCCSCPCCWKNHEKSVVVAVWRAGYGSATTGSSFSAFVQNGRNYRSWVVIHFAVVVVVVIVDTHISHYSHSFLLSAWGRILHQVEARKAKQERLTSLTTCTLTMTAQPLKQTLMLL